jgi:hypothetical protein
MDPKDEDALRQLIRKELANREQLRSPQDVGGLTPQQETEMPEERKRIIEEEISAFYQARGGYKKFVNEDGDVEWLTDAELLDRESQLPIDMEELEVGQRRVRNRIVIICLLLFAGLVLMFVLLRDRTGSVQVLCNVPGATIVLNGAATEFTTDHALQYLPTGPQVISVSKYGYVADGPQSIKVDLRAGRTEIVMLKLKPQLVDTNGRSRKN